MMRYGIAAVLGFALLPAWAHDDDDEIVFNQASELLPWCRAEAEAHYVGKGIAPYQWTGRYYDRSNVLYVEGKLRADGKDVEVRCRVARDARERYAVIEIDGNP